jgi:hypothetical protein
VNGYACEDRRQSEGERAYCYDRGNNYHQSMKPFLGPEYPQVQEAEAKLREAAQELVTDLVEVKILYEISTWVTLSWLGQPMLLPLDGCEHYREQTYQKGFCERRFDIHSVFAESIMSTDATKNGHDN